MLVAAMKLPVALVWTTVGLAIFPACRSANDGSSSGSVTERGTTTDATTSDTASGKTLPESTGEDCEIPAPGGGWQICDEIAALAPNCGECQTQWHVDFCNGVYDDVLAYDGPECVAAAESFDRCWWTTCDFDRPISEDHPCYAILLMMFDICESWVDETDA